MIYSCKKLKANEFFQQMQMYKKVKITMQNIIQQNEKSNIYIKRIMNKLQN